LLSALNFPHRFPNGALNPADVLGQKERSGKRFISKTEEPLATTLTHGGKEGKRFFNLCACQPSQSSNGLPFSVLLPDEIALAS